MSLQTTDDKKEDLELELHDIDNESDDVSNGSEEEDNLELETVEDSSEEDDNIPCNSRTSSHTSIIIPTEKFLKGKNSYQWSTVPTRAKTSRTASRNMIHFVQGPVGVAKEAQTPLQIFSLFLNNCMLEKVVNYTNKEIATNAAKYDQPSATIQQTCLKEIKALLGLMILSGALKNNHLNTEQLFNEQLSGNKFVAVMSERRFNFLIRCLRFDDKETREERKKEDSFSAIREMWDDFINNCQMYYKPGSYVTIDEQLVGFRGRCPFRMYIPSKPAKYGIKIIMMCDVKTKYMFDAAPYLGKSTKTDGLSLGEFYVKHLSRSILKSHRNVTMDNWFTSIKLASDLLKDPYQLTVVGTIRQNKAEIPPLMIEKNNSRAVGTSMFCFSEEISLVSYKAKRNKIVTLISTVHEQPIINETTKLPEIVAFYNKTKGGVDTFDQMCENSTCNRKTKRWPLAVFYNILNIAGINSWVINCHNYQRKNKKILSRKLFLFELSDELIKPWLEHRYTLSGLHKSLKAAIADNLNIENVASASNIESIECTGKRTTCSTCPAKKRRMTETYCRRCRKPFCKEHRAFQCINCE